MNLGRNFILIEKEDAYVEIIKKRTSDLKELLDSKPKGLF
jgi:DNA modification methylase